MDFLTNFTRDGFRSLRRTTRELTQMIRDFDFPSFEDEFNEIENAFKKQMDKIKERIKNLTDRFIVEVPFDKEKQELSVNVNKNVLTVVIDSYDEATNTTGNAMTQTTIPEDVDPTTMAQFYDKENKKLVFVFMKKKIDNVETKNTETTETVEETTNNTTTENVVAEQTTENVVAEQKAEGVKPKKESLMKTILEMYENGLSYRKIAAETCISDKTVKRWIQSALKEE